VRDAASARGPDAQCGAEIRLPQAGLEVATTDSPFTTAYKPGQEVAFPIAHHDGNYQIDADGLARLKGEDRIAFTYRGNPNGATADIAGVLSDNRRVLGLMPHPERVVDARMGGATGPRCFASLGTALVSA
jgi:phosphoribosylformylglycinamidine (FGAM) synthase-like amidotransferase family enzyme